MPLHIDYRPKTLDEFIGNTQTVNALKSCMERDDKPHALLMTGPSGCGKTTLARIVKDMIGCSDHDYIEMDSASFRGIDTIRQVRRQMWLAPFQGKSRMWLLDECHQVSKDGQHAMLKMLEDAPQHVFFCLATTDPQKLLKTIRSRCTTFEVGPLSDKQMTELITNVLKEESININQGALKLIIEHADGSPREALKTLDKIIDLPAEEMAEAIEQSQQQERETIELCRALLKGAKWGDVTAILKGLTQEPEAVRYAVRGYMNAVLLNKPDNRAALVIDCFRELFIDRASLTAACYDVVNPK